MNKHRAYFPLDDAPVADGDGAWTGVNARLDSSQLGPGEAAHAVNMRFDTGRPSTRKGVRILPWGAQGYQAQGSDTILPYGSVLLAEVYQDPIAGVEWLIIVTANGVYKTQPGATGASMTIAPGESVAGATDLIQTFNGLILLRGPDAAPLYLRDIDEGWLPLPEADSGKEAIPAASVGVYFQNRLCVIDSRNDSQHVDTVWVSDLGGAASVLQGDDIYQSFRINQGSADRLTGIAKFDETTLVCAKRRSIYVVKNIFGTNSDIAANALLDEVTRQYGCSAPRTFVQVGSDLWFLGSRRGVCSLRLTESNSLQGVDIPVSRDIQPIIDRINWVAADGAVAESHDNRVFFAVPIDGSRFNNAVLVYSTLTQKWAGYDSSAAIKVRDWVKFTYSGAVRLGFISTDGFVCLYETGYTDDVGDADGNITSQPIVATLRTRGYLGASAGTKRFFRASAKIATWDAAYSVTALPNGYNEARAVAGVDTDNTQYIRPYGKEDWDPVNEAGDWETAWREDYALRVDGVQVTDEADGSGTVAFDVLQEVEEVWQVPRFQGQATQLEIKSFRGRIEVGGIKIESIRGATQNKTHA